MMPMPRTRLVFALLVAIPLLAAHGGAGASDAPLRLIDPATLRAAPDLDIRVRGRNDDGPVIRIASPRDAGIYAGPFPVEVAFTPGESGAAVDPASFKLVYKRGWGIDLTSRVKGFVTAEGIRVEEAELPPGTHRLELSIADIARNRSATVITVTVDPATAPASGEPGSSLAAR